MECSIHGCPGRYEAKRIVYTLHRGSDILVFEHVPAEVYSECGDTVLAPETIERLEALLLAKAKPGKLAPMHEYA